MLSLQVYSDASLTRMLADLTSRVQPPGGGLRFSTNAHGFRALEAPLVPMTLAEAFEVYEWPGTPHVVAADAAAGVVWEGRLEDVSLVDGGVALTAFGYQRALADVPYTALWSKSGTGGWKAVTGDNISANKPEKFEMDNNNRLYITPRQNEPIDGAGNTRGSWTYAVPYGGARDFTNWSCDYSIYLPSNWRVTFYRCADDFTSINTISTHTASGTPQTGSFSLTLSSAQPRLIVSVSNNTGLAYSGAGVDTGIFYMKLTNLRMKTTTAASVLASDIVAALAAYVNGINGDQLSDATGLIEATGTDLRDELYEDQYPDEILDRLALLHGYEWGVWENRQLHFRATGSAGRDWYVDATRIASLQRSLEPVRNSAYGAYRAADGRTLRTAAAEDAAGQDRYGLVRRGVVTVDTTSQTEAETHRDTFLSDRQDRSARAQVEFDRLYDAAGGVYPLYHLRAGDTITIRNLPPTLSAEVDRIRTLTVGETEYDAAADEILVAPEDPLPTLEVLVGRREAGL